MIYAELSAGFAAEAEVEDALAELDVAFQSTLVLAFFAAGKAYLRYRRASGLRTGVLPDFFIGAHAEVMGLPILTRDPRSYLLSRGGGNRARRQRMRDDDGSPRLLSPGLSDVPGRRALRSSNREGRVEPGHDKRRMLPRSAIARRRGGS